MKRFSKLLALVLTLCLLAGAMLIFASAEEQSERPALPTVTTTNGYSYDYENLTGGAAYSANFGSGSNSAGNYSTLKAVDTGEGNKYIRFAYKADAAKAYRRDGLYGTYKAEDSPSLTHISDYSYFTLDFDLAADQYRYLIDEQVDTGETDGEGNPIMETVTKEYLSPTDPSSIDGAYGIRLAYSHNSTIVIDNRAVTKGYANNKTGGYNTLNIKLVYNSTDGLWHINIYNYRNSSGKNSDKLLDTGYTMSNNVGEWNHFTYVIKTIAKENSDSSTGITYGFSEVKLYYNGHLLGENIINPSGSWNTKAEDIVPRGVNWQINSYGNADYPNNVKYSIGMDNFKATYYPVAKKAYKEVVDGETTTSVRDPLNDVHYTSGDDALGIDDLFASDSPISSVAECEDVLYDLDWRPVYPNKDYITVNGNTSYIPYLIDKAVDSIPTLDDGSVITTNMKLENMSIKDGASITVNCVDGGDFSLSDAAIKRSTLLIETAGGYKVISNLTRVTEGSGATLVDGTWKYNDYENYSIGADANWSAGQQYGTWAKDSVLEDARGNKYLALYRDPSVSTDIFTNNGSSAYIEYALSNGNYGSYAGMKNNSLYNNYDYATLDFDFGTDRYALQIGWRLVGNSSGAFKVAPAHKTYMSKDDIDEAELAKIIEDNYSALVEYSKQEAYASVIGDVTEYAWTIDDARESLDLAYVDSATSSSIYGKTCSFYLIIRCWKSDGSKSDSMNFFLYTVKGPDGWYLSLNEKYDADKDYKLPDNPGEFSHITIAASVNHTTPKETMLYVFTDGHLFGTKKYNKDTGDYPDFFLGSLRYDFAPYVKINDCFGIAFDNMSVNYYKKGYTSGDKYGIDDYITRGDYTDNPLYNCTDVVYDRDYISAGGYIMVDGSDVVSIRDLVDEKLATVTNGSVIKSSAHLYDLAPSETVTEFTVESLLDIGVTLANSVVKERFMVVLENDQGYQIRVAEENEKVNVKWVYTSANGEVVYLTETVVFGQELSRPSAIAEKFDFDDEKTSLIQTKYKYAGWKFNISGEAEPVRILTRDEAISIDGELVINSTRTRIETYEMTEYVIGVFGEDGRFTPHLDKNGGYANYNDVSTLNSEFDKAPSGSTVILLYDDYYDIGAETKLEIGSGKTISVDLNGRTLVHTYGATSNYGNGLFYVYNGSTFNLTSSAPGAQLVEAKVNKIDSTTIYGAGGIIVVPASVDGCVINVSGDITFTAGTVYKIGGGKASKVSAEDAATADLDRKNEIDIIININGGTYYAPTRSSYAIFCNQAPDLVVNMVGAKFYVTHTSYAVFHDYDNETETNEAGVETGWTRYNNDMTVYAKDCEFICRNLDDTSYTKLFYTIRKDSYAYFEDCVIVAKIANNTSAIKGKIVLGPGNVISTNSNTYFTKNYVTVADGVSSLLNSNGVELLVERTISHAPLTNAAGHFLTSSDSKLYLNPEIYDRNNFIDSYASGKITFVTFDENSELDCVAKLNWVDLNENSLASTYAFVGDTPVAPIEISDIDGTDSFILDWYSKVYSWANTANGEYVILSGDNTMKPIATYKAEIKGMQQNATLFTDMTYNLYVPVSADVSGVLVEGANFAEETVVISGKSYYVISVTPEIEDFSATEAVIKFVTADGVALEYDVILDVVSYADAVAKHYGHATKESTLVYEMMNYKQAAAELLDSSFEAPENLLAFKASHKDCDCGVGEVAISDEEKNVDYSALIKKGVTGVSYIVNLDEMGMVISVGEGVTVTSVTYTDALGRVITHSVEAGNLIAKNGYYLVIGVSAAYIDNIMTITAGGASGTYCLGKYIVNQPSVEIAKAIYKYSVAAERYKNTVI